MRIACPSCEAEYQVPDSMLAGRSVVRCVRCGEEWRPGEAPDTPGAPGSGVADESLPAVVAPSEIATVEEPAPPAIVEAERPPALFVPPRERTSASSRASGGRAATPALIGWVLTVLVLGGALYAGYAWRDHIMAAWPPSTRLYAALGLR